MSASSSPIAIARSGTGLPSRVIFHGVEGIGKSSFGAFSPRPLFLMTRGETGLITLIDNGQIPETDHFEFPNFNGDGRRKDARTWPEVMSALAGLLLDKDAQNKTLVIDTLNGAQQLCFEHICETKYGGNMDAFLDYGRGPEVAQPEWTRFLTALDEVRAAKHMAVITLCHTRVKTFKSPDTTDYDRYTPDMNDKTWGLAMKWADVCLFGNYETFAKKEKGSQKAKGVSDGSRFLYTRRTAAWDAKNRLGLPESIPMGATAAEGWKNFFEAARRGRKAMEAPAPNGDGQA